MRSRSVSYLVAVAALLTGSAAHAGTLIAATWTQTIQGVDLTVTNSGSTCTSTGPDIVQQVIACSTGSGLAPSGTSTGTSYNVALTLPAFGIEQFTTGGSFNLATKAFIGGSQVINGGSVGAATVDQGIAGMVTVKLAAHIAKGVNASKLVPGQTTLLLVPLSVGKAGTYTVYMEPLGDEFYITANFYDWTVGTQTFTGLTAGGASLPSVVAMGSFGLTPMGGGTVTLVSPSKITIDSTSTAFQRRVLSLTTLKLSYAPEPGTLLLLGAAAAGLVLAERRKRTRG
jgi:hypothetical protein